MTTAALDRRRLLGLAGAALAAPALVACTSTRDGGTNGGTDGGTDATTPDLELIADDTARTTTTGRDLNRGARTLRAMTGVLWTGAESSGNLAFSPFSVAMALGMTVQGARGTTSTEMLDVLDAETRSSLGAACNAVAATVESFAGRLHRWKDDDAEILLDSADQLFGQRGITWRRPFLAELARDFGAGMRVVDYVGDTEAARTAINTWTAQQTHDRIPEIVPSGAITPDTRLTLVNALYFKAPWATPFETTATVPADFTLADGTVVRVPTMQATVRQGGTGDGWVSARLPYAGDTLAMTVIRPDDGHEDDVERLLASDVRRLLKVDDAGAQVALPRFTFRTELDLADLLAEAGMPTAFTDGADFAGMTSQVSLMIAHVLHQTFIAVDEAGTEAAAATAVVMTETSAQLPPERIVALDKPFLFVIHPVRAGQLPLFVGRVGDPR